MQVNLKPSLIFEWEEIQDLPKTAEENKGVEIVIGTTTFCAFLPNISRPDKRGRLTFTLQDQSKISQDELILSCEKIKTMRLFARVLVSRTPKVKELLSRPIFIEMPEKLEGRAYSIHISCHNGEFKASLDPKFVNIALSVICRYVFDSMYGAFKLHNFPAEIYQHAIMSSVFERCCNKLGVEKLNSFIKELDPHFSNLRTYGDIAIPQAVQFCYTTLGKENMRNLMGLLMLTSYSDENILDLKTNLTVAFSFFASPFDPSERTPENIAKYTLLFQKLGMPFIQEDNKP